MSRENTSLQKGAIRFYVHGDFQKDNKWFCDRYDDFCAKEHFISVDHPGGIAEHYTRYKQCLKNWRMKNRPNFYRPTDAVSLFTGRPEEHAPCLLNGLTK